MSNVQTLPKSGIYCILHVDSGRRYVGSACDIKGRWRLHRSVLLRGKHHSEYLQHAWDKYGEAAFLFQVIEAVEVKADLIAREQFWIDEYQASVRKFGFNIWPTAGSPLGAKHTEATKAKMRGRVHTEEEKAQRAASCTGRKQSEEAKEKIRTFRLSYTIPQEQIDAQSRAQKGKPKSPEHLANMRAAAQRRVGIPRSPETVAKLKASAAGGWEKRRAKANREATNLPV